MGDLQPTAAPPTEGLEGTAGFRCSVAARARGDQMVGTAPEARRWLLVEQDAHWGRTTWEGLEVEAALAVEMQEHLESVNGRLQLIRRPGARPDRTLATRRWCLVDVDWERPVLWGTATTDAELLEAARLLGGPCPPEAVRPGSPGIVLVCTHGRKDVCCAIHGRPVASSLAALWPEETWETTHTGGDRFAANVILLPDGAVYGGTDPGTAVADLSAHTDGRVDPTRLRGRCGEPQHVQVAQAVALQELGPLPWGAMSTRREEAGAERWSVDLAVASGSSDAPPRHLRVTGRFVTTEPHQLTCRAVALKPSTHAVAEVVEEIEGELA